MKLHETFKIQIRSDFKLKYDPDPAGFLFRNNIRKGIRSDLSLEKRSGFGRIINSGSSRLLILINQNGISSSYAKEGMNSQPDNLGRDRLEAQLILQNIKIQMAV